MMLVQMTVPTKQSGNIVARSTMSSGETRAATSIQTTTNNGGTDGTSDTILVSGCGIDCVNGCFALNRRATGGISYRPRFYDKGGFWRGNRGTYCVHRRNGIWFIEFKDLSSLQVTFLYRSFDNKRLLHPPKAGWCAINEGVSSGPNLDTDAAATVPQKILWVQQTHRIIIKETAKQVPI